MSAAAQYIFEWDPNKAARNQRSDVSRVVNQLLKSDMKLAKVMQ